LAPADTIAKAWLGVTAENEKFLKIRAAELVKHDARVLFFSCEPLFEAVYLAPWLTLAGGRSWVIAGGESGGKAREFQIENARDIRDQCADANTPFFMKQMGKVAMDGKTRLRLVDQAGGDINEWPDDLKIRQWPELRAA
jgi:protein gp37